jgi:HEAT repeat protein
MIVEKDKIKTELEKVGIIINDIYDLVNTNEPYPSAIPILLHLLEQGVEDVKTKEGIVRALAVKEAIGKANPILIAEYNKVPKDKMMLRWAIGNTIYTTITESDVESILSIIQDKENGMSRQMFVAALGKVKSEKAESILIKLLDDEEITLHALEALGRMKSKKAKEKIAILANHPKAAIKKEAQKSLRQILR